MLNTFRKQIQVLLALLVPVISDGQAISSFTGNQFVTEDGITYSINSTKQDDGNYPAMLVSIPSSVKGKVKIPETIDFTISKLSGSGIPPGWSWVQSRKKAVWFGKFDSLDWNEEDDKDEVRKAKVMVVGNKVFANRSDITDIQLPNSVTSIWTNAFQNCTALKSFVFPKQVAYVWDAFRGCSSLEKVDVNGNIEELPQMFFAELGKLKKVSFKCPLKKIPYGCFYKCDSLQSVELPQSLEEIASYSFCSCISLDTLTIPTTVNRIGEYAFWDCQSLRSVKIPTKVKKIEKATFLDCYELQWVDIPKSVDSIGMSAFARCWKLKEISIHSGVKNIESSAFGGCQLQDIYVHWITPPAIDYHVFTDNAYQYAILHIPSSGLGVTSSMILNNYLQTYAWNLFKLIDDGINRYNLLDFYMNVYVSATGGGSVIYNGKEDYPLRDTSLFFSELTAVPIDIQLSFEPDEGCNLLSVQVKKASADTITDLIDNVKDGKLVIEDVYGETDIYVTFQDGLSGIFSIVSKPEKAQSVFTLDGRKCQDISSGLNIIRYADGSIRKMWKK